jgi:uncharacterized RDD family membrane protein YckC
VSAEPDPQPTVLPFAPASPGKRFVGATVDGVLFALLALSTASGDVANPFGLALAWLLISAAYEIGLTATRGQTLGKLLAGTQVLDVSGQRLPTWWQASVRWFVQGIPNLIGLFVVSSAVDLVSLVWAVVIYLPIVRAVDHRGWHDHAAGTIVIDRRPSGPPAE